VWYGTWIRCVAATEGGTSLGCVTQRVAHPLDASRRESFADNLAGVAPRRYRVRLGRRLWRKKKASNSQTANQDQELRTICNGFQHG
jgi:hypothetical protein